MADLMAANDDDGDAAESSLRELASLVLSDHTSQGLLAAITGLAQRTLPGCRAASITLVREGRPTTSASSGEIAGEADSWQYEDGDGPCLAAIRRSEVVSVDSFAHEGRWPGFADRAVACGIHSSLSLPLVVHGDIAGALNLYGGEVGAFAGHEAAAWNFAGLAAVTLANARALYDAQDLAGQLAGAMEHREVIGQAIGILMATEDVSPDGAMGMLRRASNRSNRKVADIADDIVDRRGRTAS